LRRTHEGNTEFLLISYWDSYEAIRAFAGDDLERAVYYPRDQEFLLELEPKVTHYEVATTL
jgi:heme-degrading monooxygenase HmoA